MFQLLSPTKECIQLYSVCALIHWLGQSRRDCISSPGLISQPFTHGPSEDTSYPTEQARLPRREETITKAVLNLRCGMYWTGIPVCSGMTEWGWSCHLSSKTCCYRISSAPDGSAEQGLLSEDCDHPISVAANTGAEVSPQDTTATKSCQPEGLASVFLWGWRIKSIDNCCFVTESSGFIYRYISEAF